MMDPLKVAVVGAGRMGRHHARIYHELPEARLVAVIDADESRAAEVASKYGAKAFSELSEEVLAAAQAVTVAVPTVSHLSAAAPFIERGIPVLIEKPIAPDPASARALLDLAEKHRTLLQVGHTERFNPVVRALTRLDITPKFIETHRISPFTFRSADIGVVMDMMIHDIDIVLHLVRRNDWSVDAVGVNVLGPHEDIANARVRFPNGSVANLTASRLALKTERKIRVFSPTAYLSLDYQKKSGISILKDANLDLLKLARERNYEDLSQLQHLDFGSMVKITPLAVDDVEPLRAEIQSFLSAVREGGLPAVTGAEGLAAVQLAHDIVASLKRHSWDGSERTEFPIGP